MLELSAICASMSFLGFSLQISSALVVKSLVLVKESKYSRGPFEAFTSFQKMGNTDHLNKEKGIPCRKEDVEPFS